jgi:hypothetical protein
VAVEVYNLEQVPFYMAAEKTPSTLLASDFINNPGTVARKFRPVNIILYLRLENEVTINPRHHGF